MLKVFFVAKATVAVYVVRFYIYMHLKKMALKNTKPVVENVRLPDAPEKDVTEFFHSKNAGVCLIEHEVNWDQVPPCPAQLLLQAARGLSEARQEARTSSSEYEARKRVLQQKWSELQQLQFELKQLVNDTEQEIKQLQQDEAIALCSAEETRSEGMKGQEELLLTKTSELLRAASSMEDHSRLLEPFYKFISDAAESRPGFYAEGAKSVLLHYERLCDVHNELESRQANALAHLRDLYCVTQSFSAHALNRLDELQAEILTYREKLEKEILHRNGCSQRLRMMRFAAQLQAAEEQEIREAVLSIFEHLWRRYHPKSDAVQSRDINGQAMYIQQTVLALERLAHTKRDTQSATSDSLGLQFSTKEYVAN